MEKVKLKKEEIRNIIFSSKIFGKFFIGILLILIYIIPIYQLRNSEDLGVLIFGILFLISFILGIYLILKIILILSDALDGTKMVGCKPIIKLIEAKDMDSLETYYHFMLIFDNNKIKCSISAKQFLEYKIGDLIYLEILPLSYHVLKVMKDDVEI